MVIFLPNKFFLLYDIPVSYTHLDVYKRQPHTPIGPITTISKGITINALRNGTKILRKAFGSILRKINSHLDIK